MDTRHLADLVEEQRAPVGLLEAAFAAALGAGERALLVAEELGFHQRLGDRRTVEADERALAARAVDVQRTGDDLLACPGLAADQHGGLRRRHLGDRVQQPQHGRAAADDAAALEASRQLGAQRAVLRLQPGVLHGAFERDAQLVEVERLGEVVVRPLLESGHGRLDRGEGGHDDDRDGRVDRLDGRECLEPRHLQHAHVHQHQVVGPLADPADGGLAVVRLGDFVAPAADQGAQHGAVGRVVIHDQNGMACAHAGLPRAAASSGRRRVKVLPEPGRLATAIVPPMAPTMLCAIASPRPVPPGRVVK